MRIVTGFLTALIFVFAIAGCGASGNDSGNGIQETFATADFQKFAVSLQGEDVGYMTMKTETIGDSLFISQSMEWHLLLWMFRPVQAQIWIWDTLP